MKRTLSLFLMLVLLLLAGCNDPKPLTDALHRVEALMNEYPDSAWAVLNALSPDEMGQSRTRAHYALLYTQAQDKTYRDETNDSLISIAVDYYRHTDDARHMDTLTARMYGRLIDSLYQTNFDDNRRNEDKELDIRCAYSAMSAGYGLLCLGTV